MADEYIRKLEREAATGGPDAAKRLVRERERLQVNSLWVLELVSAVSVSAPQRLPEDQPEERPIPFTAQDWNQAVDFGSRLRAANQARHSDGLDPLPAPPSPGAFGAEPDTPEIWEDPVRSIAELRNVSGVRLISFVLCLEDGYAYQHMGTEWEPTHRVRNAIQRRVVRAASEEQARAFASEGGGVELWVHPNRSSVAELVSHGEAGVIL